MSKAALFLAIALCSLPAFAREGVTVRGGGDDAALEFTTAFASGLTDLAKFAPELSSLVNAEATRAALARTVIFVEDDETVNDRRAPEAVAFTDVAENRIFLNRARWQAVAHSRLREAIALHEVLTLSGVENEARFTVSAGYLAKFNLPNAPLVFQSGQFARPADGERFEITCRQGNKSRRFAEIRWVLVNKPYSLRLPLGNGSAAQPRPAEACQARELTPEDWSALLPDPRLAIELEKLTARAERAANLAGSGEDFQVSLNRAARALAAQRPR